MTKLIAAYPCLGKTTLSKWNRTSIFDREFNESRSIIGMSTEQIQLFFKACADIICLQLQTNTYEILFITEDERLLMELNKRGIKPILIFPDAFIWNWYFAVFPFCSTGCTYHKFLFFIWTLLCMSSITIFTFPVITR